MVRVSLCHLQAADIADLPEERAHFRLLNSVHGPKGPVANPDNGDCMPLFLANIRKKIESAGVQMEFGASA